jgi:hypothetical protein
MFPICQELLPIVRQAMQRFTRENDARQLRTIELILGGVVAYHGCRYLFEGQVEYSCLGGEQPVVTGMAEQGGRSRDDRLYQLW